MVKVQLHIDLLNQVHYLHLYGIALAWLWHIARHIASRPGWACVTNLPKGSLSRLTCNREDRDYVEFESIRSEMTDEKEGDEHGRREPTDG